MSSPANRAPNSRKNLGTQRLLKYCALAGVAALAICAGVLRAGGHAALRPASLPPRFSVSFGSNLSATPLDGRVYVAISTTDNPEPRFGIVEQEAHSQQIFGVDVDAMKPGDTALFGDDVLGYPARSFKDLVPGDYFVQAVFNKYTTFHRSDGYTVKLPMDEGEGQHWNRKPGNFYSKPQKVHLDPTTGNTVQIQLTEVIPPITPPQDTEWVKHIRLQSGVLTKFWGRPMYLGAIVVLPDGWATHPNAHYPLLVNEGHFQADFNGFRTGGGRRGGGAPGQPSPLFQDWSTGKLPHMILVIIQHANPYYDDSYAVDSANVGPYGEAINHELIPYIEKNFRAIGQGWAHALYGGSTGGWETLATQVFYPDDYNGAWTACPDPVDFHAYQSTDIYDDPNAYWEIGPFGRVPHPDMRATTGMIEADAEPANRWELVLGTHSRSGEQWNIWQAVFSPVGPDGYPKPIWDPITGVIDKNVATYWRDHYDLNYIMQRDWHTLGPKLVGKLHFTVGTADTYFLDNAVRLLQRSLSQSQNPHYEADFDYGAYQPHCYTGAEGSATFTQRVLMQANDWMLKTAPAGADVTSWRY
jgi:hypothetical protein